MEGEVIKSFLVGLGFSVDDASLSKFNKSITSAAIKVTALYTSIQVAAAGIFKAVSGIAEGFETMGYEMRLVAPAMNKFLILRQYMLSTYSKAGINLVKVVQQSIKFNLSLAKTKIAFEAIYKSVGAKFLPLLTKQMDIFRGKILQNMPKIQAQLMKLVEFIFKAFSATVELGTRLWSILGRVWDFFVRLDEATGGWSTKIIGAIAAWKLLNLEFLATPLGMIIAGLAAILVLFDDFEVWKEGGKSLFDWAPFVPVIDAVEASLKGVWDILNDVFAVLFEIIGMFVKLMDLDFSGLSNMFDNFLSDTKKLVDDIFSSIEGLFKLFDVTGSWLTTAINAAGSLFGGGNKNQGGINQPQPLVPGNTTNSNRINQQTTINVNGAADAHSVGREVVGQQNLVNFNVTRNTAGRTQ